MDYNAIETQGTEITAEKEEKGMNKKKVLKTVGIIAGVSAGAALLIKLGKTIFGNKSDNCSECDYVEFDPDIDTIESDVND